MWVVNTVGGWPEEEATFVGASGLEKTKTCTQTFLFFMEIV